MNKPITWQDLPPSSPILQAHQPHQETAIICKLHNLHVRFFSLKNPTRFRFTSPTSPSKRTNQQAPENQQAKLPLPDSRSMDWNSLVNTATKAINTDDETTIVDLENDPQRKEKRYNFQKPILDQKSKFYVFLIAQPKTPFRPKKG